MKYTIYLNERQKNQLEYEVVSTDLKVHLVRLIEQSSRFRKNPLINMNSLINRSRSLDGEAVYILNADDWGDYEDYDYAWHQGEFEIIFRRLDTVSFVEFLCELIEREWFNVDEINALLKQENASFSIEDQNGSIEPYVLSLEELHEQPIEKEHPNIRILIDRMETALEAKDYGGVLHSSASVFETLAKDIVGIPTIQNQTLKSFFDRYKKDSQLPEELRFFLGEGGLRITVMFDGH